jgi:hypothetical protein
VTSRASQTANGVTAWIGTISKDTGTTATVVANTSGANFDGMVIGIYALYNWSGSVHDTAVNTVSPIDLAIDIPQNGIAICCAAGSGATGMTWTNATERTEVDIENSDRGSIADRIVTSSENATAIACAISGSSPTACGCAASFGGV